jgi:hypothetical protein
MRTRFQPSELRTAKLWWIVSFDFGGRTWRVSQGCLSIESTDLNRWISVSAGLDTAEAQLSAPWMGSAPEQRSISLEMSIPELDVGLLLSRNYELDGAPVELAIWREGDTWEDRLQILRGQVTSYEWGAKGEVLAIEAEEAVELDRGLIPPAGATVSALTWPGAPEDALGAPYPWILGAPGSDGTPASPACYVDMIPRNLLLVAGHPVSAASVVVSDGSSTESLLIEHIADGVGRIVAVVDLDTATSIIVDPTLAYSVAWTTGSGLVGNTGSDAVGAGSVIEAFLAYSTLPIDRGSLAAVRSYLDAWKIGAYIVEPISPMEWVVDALLPLLPVAILTGPQGWRIVPTPLEPTRAATIGTLTAPQSIRRDGRVRRIGRDEVANRVELLYGIEAAAGEPRAAAIVGPSWDGIEHPALPTRLSAQIYGSQPRSEETVAVYDAPTAMRIARHIASIYAYPRDALTYTGQRLQWVQPADILWISDADLHLERAGWVETIRLTPDTASADLVMWRANV